MRYLYSETEYLSVTDGLTGLYNRRYFEINIEREFLRTSRYKTKLSLAMIDIVPFKVRKQISLSTKGKIRSKEHCENISKGLTGKIQTEEHRRNNSKGQTGKKLSESTKQKIGVFHQKYSDEIILDILELRKKNLTWNKISILLNIPEGTVNGLVKRLSQIEKSI